MTEIMIIVMTWLRDIVHKLNRTGPRTDSCGTPNGRCCGQDSVPYNNIMLMLWCMSEKYDLNHGRAAYMCKKCQNVYEGIVKGLNYQSYRKQLRDQVK